VTEKERKAVSVESRALVLQRMVTTIMSECQDLAGDYLGDRPRLAREALHEAEQILGGIAIRACKARRC